jgi:archaellum component FlaG (FlaF/FlaG flagellin family)
MSLPITTTNNNSLEVSLYPNPTANAFKLLIKNSKASGLSSNQAIVKVIDIQGRMMKSFQANTNQVIAIGNELKPGVYMVEVRLGEEVKTIRAVKF